MSTWTLGLTELDGTPIGEVLNASERKLSLPLNGLPTASFQIRSDNPMASEILSRDGDVMAKIYQDSTLRFFGDILSVEEVGDGDGISLAVNAAGLLWRLQKRLIGIPYPSAQAAWPTATAANTIIDTLINNTNALGAYGDTGIRLGTRDTLYATTIGTEPTWAFKPISEAITDMQESKIPYPVETPPNYVAVDTFAAAGVVDGRTDLEGNHWDSNGSGSDWTTTTSVTWPATGQAYRTSAANEDRWAISDAPAVGPLVAGGWWISDLRARSTFPLYQGFYVRLSGETAATPQSGIWLRVMVYYGTTGGTIFLQKRVTSGGTITTLGSYAWPGVTSSDYYAGNVWYAFRLLVDESGNYWVWNYRPDLGTGIGYPLIAGQDADLAAGGTLATGKLAFEDAYLGGAVSSRGITNVFVSDYTGPQSFDFEVAPIEPTGTPVKLGDLNVRTSIGTTKPEVIFEYGTGLRSVKGYRSLIDRQGLLNTGYVLPSDFVHGTTSYTEIRWDQDLQSIQDRGLFEEVIPSDVQDSQLRQALAEAHVFYRKTPRHLITFDPSETAPVFGTDYIVGDYVTARALGPNGEVRFNALFRVYQVEISIDENGKADVATTVVAS